MPVKTYARNSSVRHSSDRSQRWITVSLGEMIKRREKSTKSMANKEQLLVTSRELNIHSGGALPRAPKGLRGGGRGEGVKNKDERLLGARLAEDLGRHQI